MPSPNILLFMVDQLSAFVLRSYGGRTCQTPNLDRLTDRGTVFEQAFCSYPLCAPSRCSLMTGRLPSRIGAFDNGAEFAAAIPTFAHHARLAGYDTCLSGKMHFVGPDQLHGFETRLTPEIYPTDMSWTPDPLANAPGFGVSTMDTVLDAGPVAGSMQIDYDEDVTHQAIRKLHALARAPERPPFLLTVSLTQPHDPYVSLPEYWALYEDVPIDPPQVPPIPPEARDPHSRSLYAHYSQDKAELTDQDYIRARRGYFAMISHIDALFGRVMTALEDLGFADNTVVIFTSDHGDMMGERGMWFKKTLFNPAIQVPLILAQPGGAAGRVAGPVSLLDVCPTILELTGTDLRDVPHPLDGHSLLPMTQGAARQGPVFCEHIDGGTEAPRVAVIDGAYKLVASRAYPTQLYDLNADPLEQSDLAGQGHPAETQLMARVEETWDLDQLHRDVIASQRARGLVDRALATGAETAWSANPADPAAYVRRGDRFPDVERRGYIPEAGRRS